MAETDDELRERQARLGEELRLVGVELARRGHWPPFHRCPRCGRIVRDIEWNTTSRVTVERDVAICDLCGELEAQRDMGGKAPVPPDEWPMDAGQLGADFAALCQRQRQGELRWVQADQLETGEEPEA
jgi:hypothetical protein